MRIILADLLNEYAQMDGEEVKDREARCGFGGFVADSVAVRH